MFFLVLEDVRWFWQEGTVKNQREHLVLLLANAQMRLQPQATNQVGFVLPPNFSMQLGIVLEFKSSIAHLLQSGWNCHQVQGMELRPRRFEEAVGSIHKKMLYLRDR